MKFLATCWLIAIMLLGPAAVHAGGCRNVAVRHNNVVVVKEVVKVVEAVVTPIVAQFVAIPTYNAIYGGGYQYPGYAPPAYAPPAYQPQAVAPCDKHDGTMKQIASILQELDGRLSRLEGGGTPAQAKPPLKLNPMEKVEDGQQGAAPQAPAGGDRLLVLATKNCASCHDQGRAASSGKGFVLTQGGKLAPLNEQQLGLLISEVSSKHMPRGGSMSDAERLEFLSLLVNGPAPK